MVKRITGNGLGVNLLKLHGTLELRFTADATYTVFHKLQCEDTVDTEQIEQDRLEMYLEKVDGILDVTYRGEGGSKLSFRHDGRVVGTYGVDNGVKTGKQNKKRHATQEDTKTQTLGKKTRSITMQTSTPLTTHIGTQTRLPIKATYLDKIAADTPTFTTAVTMIFDKFNESYDASHLKREASPPTDHKAYTHIYIEGYRNAEEDGGGQEGRLHIDLLNHVLIWESYNAYNQGVCVTLDRLEFPKCLYKILAYGVVGYRKLESIHCFGDYQLFLCLPKSRHGVFTMDYESLEAKIFGTTAESGNDRYYLTGCEGIKIAVAAARECLEWREKNGGGGLKVEDDVICLE
ncbi:conserved hypothetical protein [Pyrenophora tritici-repentis Pt-1C-BFP]|uniref:Uncharacterized protein n=1 Tax=Pyrenophora tritici-repentis (strain Pt-1C-BFP) TaxID=426418 RepID=B2WAW3_PYRTR|nr:uncharacterized protein PTRG_07426 [Pyrenophora tritici-repentis Pt-1C-BFP]EDU50345.1 conserved hypothetical protein [Pyrenophora tritici-repentis Pt-1C-BFP]